jgi:hypothetical protein
MLSRELLALGLFMDMGALLDRHCGQVVGVRQAGG